MKAQIIFIIQWLRKFFREKFHYNNEDLPYYVTILVAFILFVVGLNGFVELTDELVENELEPYDTAVTDFILNYRNDSLTGFFRFATMLGDGFAYMVIILALTAYFVIKHKRWKFIVQVVVVLLLSTLSNIMLKKVINRSRPSIEHLVSVSTLSYPSGHSMSAMAFYGFLIYLSLRYRIAGGLKIFFITLLILIILSVGLSRIYLGVHYPSDVAGGFIGGLIWITFCAIVFNITGLWLKRKSRNSNSISE